MQAHALTLQTVMVIEDDPVAQARASRLVRDVAGDAVRIDIAGDIAAARVLAENDIGYDLALVDLQLPDGNGVDFIGWLRELRPALPAVIVSSWAEEGTILAALRNGAIGYLLKHAEDVELAMGLRSLQRGGAAIDPMIARRILELMPKTLEAAMPTAAEAPTERLSEREYEILAGVERGLSNREIAESTGLSKLTIETHTRNIYRKLAVHSRTGAVHAARERGLLR